MKAFVAIMLIAAVSGQITTGVDKNVIDYLRYRTMYPQGQVYQGQQQYQQGQYQRGGVVPTTGALYNYIQQLQETINGDMTTTGQLGGLVQPSTQQVNIPSDVFTYTLRQMYTMPLFQEYYNIPLFRELLVVPAFQRYIVSSAFQQYWTQAVFKNFFVDPVLFYKYIFPVVIQFGQNQVGQYKYQPLNGQYQYNTQVDGVTIPEMFRGLGNNFNVNNVNTLYGRHVPTTYNNNLYTTLYNILNKHYQQGVVPEYNTVNDLFNTINVNKFDTKTVYPQVYGNGYYGKYNKQNLYNNRNIFDVLTGKTELYPFGTVGQQVNTPFGIVGQKVNTPFGIVGQNVNTPFGIVGQNVNTPFGIVGQQMINTPFGTTDKTAEIYLEKIVKDLLKGKLDINDLKDTTHTTLLNEQINKIVDPITGEYKIVEEKIVKPIETVQTEGELTQDALVKKMLLNKAIFNKL